MIKTRYCRCAVLLLMVFFYSLAQAGIESVEFSNAQMAEDYSVLVHELRCLVCQNQSLADSNAELAQDLRQQVVALLNEGASRDDVVDYMVTRYGDFVLYRPPFKATTVVLWVGPFMLIVVGFVIVFMFIRKQADQHIEMTQQEREKIRSLLKDD